MSNLVLVGCIKTINRNISSRFFYVNKDEGTIRDVTAELCKVIKSYNNYALRIIDSGKYEMTIPYSYKNGLAIYSYGCGLSHFLQTDYLPTLVEKAQVDISFELADCYISMFTPSDVKNILGCKDVFEEKITDAIIKYFY